MRNVWLTRVNAIFLAVMLVGGGSGLPVFDAIFHHLHVDGLATPKGVESSDALPSHGERCTLGIALPAVARPADLPAAVRDAVALATTVVPPSADAPRAAAFTAPSRPRPPPVPLV